MDLQTTEYLENSSKKILFESCDMARAYIKFKQRILDALYQ